MAGLDRETVERVARWCAEAGRTAGSAAIRAALEPLGWDELLLARALLADPPPGRPLGPFALADLARGAPLDQAVEREREGRYPSVDGPADAEAAPPMRAAAPAKPRGRAARAARLAPVLRRKPQAPPPPPPAALPPLLDVLLLPAGRNDLERLIRRHGGRSAALLAALAGAHRRADGQPVDRADLDRLLEHHDLARGYQRRERDELIHAVRAAGAVLAGAAAALGTDRDGLLAAAARLGVERDVEALRVARRRELGARATLSERARLLVVEAARLEDLGLLESFEVDLRARLPEHLRALGASREPLLLALSSSLSLEPEVVSALVAKLGLALDSGARPPRREGPPREGPPREGRPPRREGPSRAERPSRRDGPPREVRPPRRDGPPRPSGSGGRGPRSGGPDTARPRSLDRRPPGAAPAADRSGGPRPGGRPPSGARPGGSRPGGPPPRGPRPGGTRPSGPRPASSRPGGPRQSGPPSRGPRPGVTRGPRRPAR